MANLNFFIKSTQKGKLVPIYVRFYHGRVKKGEKSNNKDWDLRLKIGQYADPAHWNKKKHCVGNFIDAPYKDDVNSNLRKLKDHVLEVFASYKGDVSKEWLTKVIDKFYNPEKYAPEKVTLFSFIRDYIDKAPTRIKAKHKKPVGYKQIREYETTFRYLKEFAQYKGKTEIDFEDITLDFHGEFCQYLQTDRVNYKIVDGKRVKEVFKGLQPNTVGKKVMTLKVFLNAATYRGINSKLEFKSEDFVTPSEDVKSVYLNEDELSLIGKLDLSDNKRLDPVRDLFLIGSWTGLRFGDWDKVRPENIEGNRLRITQAKTMRKVAIPLHPVCRAILNKYSYSLPETKTNQEFNRCLKDICKLAGIDTPWEYKDKIYKKWELVSTHSARRSFASNMYKRRIPIVSIMAITGHRTEKSFLNYISLTPEQQADIMADEFEKDSVGYMFPMRVSKPA